jgi:hypothetical protein
VGTRTFPMAVATGQSPAKPLWHQAGVPTSRFGVAGTIAGREAFSGCLQLEDPSLSSPSQGEAVPGSMRLSSWEPLDRWRRGLREARLHRPTYPRRAVPPGQGGRLEHRGQRGECGPPSSPRDSVPRRPLHVDVRQEGAGRCCFPLRCAVEQGRGGTMADLATSAHRPLGFRYYSRIDTSRPRQARSPWRAIPWQI